MTDRHQPPAVPAWLVARCVSGARGEALLGDLIEAYQDGRSSAWYWRQALRAVTRSLVLDVWQSRWIAGAALLLGVYLNDIFMFIVRPYWIYILDAWYRQLIDLLLKLEWDGARHVAYDLGLGFLTIRILWCLCVGALVWSLARLSGARRVPFVMVVLPQLGQAVLLILPAVRDWLRDPDTAYSTLNLLWYVTFLTVAVPFSAHTGGRWGAGAPPVQVANH